MWQPTISIENLKKRAFYLQKVREFFARRSILEVDVPILGEAPVTDPYLTAMETHCQAYPNKTFYLQTSPEYFMKRLLAFGAPSIYYLGKAFRDDERGRLHSSEFTMLEWYHLGIDDHALMQEVAELMQLFLGELAVEKITYKELFQKHLGLNPHSASAEELAALVQQHMGKIEGLDHLPRDTSLQLLMSEVIEPKLDFSLITFIYDFPASQAALARLRCDTAARFEVYHQGIELANGYYELNDADTQAKRFAKDLAVREAQKLKKVPVDHRLLQALEHHFPECAGIALGFDRLLMLALGEKNIDAVQSFGFNS
jgi:elongation factor P--(R)-beta-lysine ligase